MASLALKALHLHVRGNVGFETVGEIEIENEAEASIPNRRTSKQGGKGYLILIKFPHSCSITNHTTVNHHFAATVIRI
jgi:hypothetical protein